MRMFFNDGAKVLSFSFGRSVAERFAPAPREIRQGMRWAISGSLTCNSFEIVRIHSSRNLVDILERNVICGNRLVRDQDWNQYWRAITSTIPEHIWKGSKPRYSGSFDVSDESISEALARTGFSFPKVL